MAHKPKTPRSPQEPQEALEIDFTAPLPSAPAPEVPLSSINNYIIGSSIIDGSDLIDDKRSAKPRKLKDQLKEVEIRFLEIYIRGNISIDNAMIQAGYTNLGQTQRYMTARKIVKRYEEGARGAREVMRACGVGEVRVAKKIDGLMEDPSTRTQLGATELAARVLGMTQEQRGPTQGIQIIINTAPAAAPQGVQPGPPVIEVKESKRLPPQTKPLQITK